MDISTSQRHLDCWKPAHGQMKASILLFHLVMRWLSATIIPLNNDDIRLVPRYDSYPKTLSTNINGYSHFSTALRSLKASTCPNESLDSPLSFGHVLAFSDHNPVEYRWYPLSKDISYPKTHQPKNQHNTGLTDFVNSQRHWDRWKPAHGWMKASSLLFHLVICWLSAIIMPLSIDDIRYPKTHPNTWDLPDISISQRHWGRWKPSHNQMKASSLLFHLVLCWLQRSRCVE